MPKSKKAPEEPAVPGGLGPSGILPLPAQGPWKLGYVDFWPNVTKQGGSFSFPEFEPFGPCLQRCNQYLMANPHLEVVNAESVENKIRYGGCLNPEIMTYLDYTNAMCFVRGLRIWIRPRQNPGPPTQLGYINVLPGLLQKGGMMSEPVFENLPTVVENVNKMFRDRPLPGRILTIETQDMKVNHGLFSSNNTINPDQSAWIERPGHVFLFVLRIFYIAGEPVMEEIGFSDFLPTCLQGGSWTKLPQFTPVHQTVIQAQGWIKQYEGSIRVTNIQALEHKVNYGYGFSTSTVIDPIKMSYWNRQLTVFIRGIRVAYVKAMAGQSIPPSPPIVLTERVFYPVQLTNVKTFTLPVFETLSQTIYRANEWLKHVDANVVAVETVPIRIMAQTYGMGSDYIGADASFSVGEGGGRKQRGCYMQMIVRIYLDNYYTEPAPHLLPPLPQGIRHWQSLTAPTCSVL